MKKLLNLKNIVIVLLTCICLLFTLYIFFVMPIQGDAITVYVLQSYEFVPNGVKLEFSDLVSHRLIITLEPLGLTEDILGKTYGASLVPYKTGILDKTENDRALIFITKDGSPLLQIQIDPRKIPVGSNDIV